MCMVIFITNFNQGLIPNTIYKILKKEEVTIWGDGSSKRDYLFAEDLAYVVCQMILEMIYVVNLMLHHHLCIVF